MGVKNIVKRVADKAGNRVAKMSALSSEQVAEIQLYREKYLLEKPDPSDELAMETTWKMMASASVEVFNSYIPQIKDLYLPIDKDVEYEKEFNVNNNVRYLNITKWVSDKKENSLEKLVNVYSVLSNEECNIALIFNRTQKTTNVYLAVSNLANADNNVDANSYKNRLLDAIKGNFPGAECVDNNVMGKIPCLDDDRRYSVATATNIPTEKSEKFVSQTIEKLLDGIVPDSNKKEYTIVLLATPIKDIEERKNRLSEFYSGMRPYAEWETSYIYNENNSVGSSATMGVNIGASAGIQNGNNYSTTDTDAETDNESITATESESDSLSYSESVAENESQSHMEGTNETVTNANTTSNATTSSESYTSGKNKNGNAGVNIGIPGLFSIGGGGSAGKSSSTTTGNSITESIAQSVSNAIGKSASDTVTKGITNTVSSSVGKTIGTSVANTLGKAVTKSMAVTKGVSKATNMGLNAGASFARSSTVTAMIGKNEGITQHFANYGVKHAMELLDNQMKRYEQSSALGMWDFAAYVISEDSDVVSNVAHDYLALTMGEDSYMSKSAVNIWKGNTVDEDERIIASEIVSYIKELRHPMFALNANVVLEDKSFCVYPPIVTATTSLSGKELAYSLNFPQRSIAGLPVLECAEFGRTVVTYDDIYDYDKKVDLGNVYHMYHPEKNRVELTTKSLASHTFITGSTGSGKSNTVYQMLGKLKKENVKFLVVEPAKGEYKHVFGNKKDVSVYGTNPALMPLLKINPFSFDDTTHVLEHLDRLIEIFNVCWPMYAAMPAVLKNAVEKSYEDCGWDLLSSRNKYGENIYPTFNDVARNVSVIIESSEYDAENKGAYKGSLLTRLQSLTNGINGLVFSIDEIPAARLFDENVIIDLSRVGSSETKALIMGILVLKLQEYRMSQTDDMNSNLKHVTVLEEAHNLLRRTSIEQSADSSNLLGKSVEMLANAIAEMRTYGEGFIIADQAPGLMDMSVIRNTNTKIIMRLPDQADRELVGKAANLNDDQITELAKLPCGVAAIYQNEWVQPVLCKIDKSNNDEKRYLYHAINNGFENEECELKESLLDCIMDKELLKKGNKAYIRRLKKKVIESKLDASIKCDIMEYLKSDNSENMESLRVLLYDFLSAQNAIISSRDCNNLYEWVHSVVEKLSPSIKKYSNKQIDLAMALILNEHTNIDASYNDLFCSFTEVYKKDGGVY